MSDKIYLGSRLADLDFGEPSLPISKVILNVDGETCYQSGDDTGATIEADCPWATQAMADSILAKMQGFVYKPFTGTDALLNPSAELGDGITLGGVYGVLSQLGRNLDRQATATVGAPGTDEIEDEYPYKSKQRKQTDRTLAKAYSLISKTAEEIRLEVFGEDGPGGTSLRSEIAVAIGKIELSVSNGSTSSTISLKAGETVIDSANISFSGFVTFSGLSGGTTTIDGACIKTGTISADRIDADNLVLTNSANIANNFIVDQYGNVTINGNINLSGGTITWGSNNPADGSGLTDDDVETIITKQLVKSPTIAGGVFYNLPQTHSLEMSASGSDYGTFRLYNQYYGKVPYFSIYDDTYGCLDLYAAGNKFLRYDYGTYPQGEWNFQNATVTNLTATFG